MNNFFDFQFTNLAPGQGQAVVTGGDLNNRGLQAAKSGNYALAERLYLESIDLKERQLGANAVTTALTRNALGELYLNMGKLDEAEENLKKALAVRSTSGPVMDAAVTRDNLGQLYEMRGDFKAAKASRLAGAPDKMVCSNYTCPKMQVLKFSDLNQCAKCKAAFYCSKNCQVTDWKTRHKKYCKAQ